MFIQSMAESFSVELIATDPDQKVSPFTSRVTWLDATALFTYLLRGLSPQANYTDRTATWFKCFKRQNVLHNHKLAIS
jgi:hypothetical protein